MAEATQRHFLLAQSLLHIVLSPHASFTTGQTDGGITGKTLGAMLPSIFAFRTQRCGQRTLGYGFSSLCEERVIEMGSTMRVA